MSNRSDLELLEELITDDARVQIVEYYGKGLAILTDPDSPASKAEIYGLPIDSIVFKVDKFPAPVRVFKGTKGENRRADYAIICEEKGMTRIVYIEMKLTKAPHNHIVNQLTGARCFMHFCQEVGRSFWKQPDFLKSATHRFVSIAHTSIPKGPTRMEQRFPVNDQPEKLWKISYPHKLRFNQLFR